MWAYHCLQTSKSPSLSIMIHWPWGFLCLFYAICSCSDIAGESKTSKTTKVGSLSRNHPIWIYFSLLQLVPPVSVVLWRNILHHIISFATKLSIWQDEKKLLQPLRNLHPTLKATPTPSCNCFHFCCYLSGST